MYMLKLFSEITLTREHHGMLKKTPYLMHFYCVSDEAKRDYHNQLNKKIMKNGLLATDTDP